MSKIKLPIICPHCGSSDGVCHRIETEQYYDEYGKAIGYSSEPIRENKTLYCNSCYKPVCRLSTFMKLIIGQNN